MEQQSTLSDAFVRQLMAVGQVDVLVGLPTLNNAATVVDVVRAVHVSFTRDFPRLRTVMINSDGGSTDGTPELIRAASFTEADVVQTSHSLRTLHRVVAPYHGLPGKHAVLRTLFAAVELTQASVLVVVDPGGPATSRERVTELITPVARKDVEFLAPCYRRHPRDGVLITQFVRPLVRAVYGVALDEPLGGEFSCSRRFASHCLEQAIWEHEVARFAIDLWLRTEAVAHRFAVGQIWRPATTAVGRAGHAPRGRAAGRAGHDRKPPVARLVLDGGERRRAAADVGDRSAARRPTRRTGTTGAGRTGPPRHRRDQPAARGSARRGHARPGHRRRIAAPVVALDDELWVRIVYAFASAARRGRTSREHLAAMFVPLYLWRAATFMAQTAREDCPAVQARLDSLCGTFERLKPVLVSNWSAEV